MSRDERHPGDRLYGAIRSGLGGPGESGTRGGPLITAGDVPGGPAGRLPVTIGIGENGDPWVQAPSDPGWFGN